MECIFGFRGSRGGGRLLAPRAPLGMPGLAPQPSVLEGVYDVLSVFLARVKKGVGGGAKEWGHY